MAHKTRFALLWLLLAAAPAFAGLDSQVRGIIDAADLRGVDVSLMAADADTGEVLLEVDVDRALVPASNMKIVTTSAALRVLGPDYLFKTDLALVNETPDAAILCVRGGGDPAFGDPELLHAIGYDVDALVGLWIKAITDAGITHIKQLILDDRVFDRQWFHPDWPENQMHKWYCAQVAGINFNNNCLDLFPAPTRFGQAPNVSMRPHVQFVQVVNRAVTGDANTFWSDRRPEENVFTYRGKVKTARVKAINVTLHDPAMFFGKLLAERLAGQGVDVASIVRPGEDDRIPQGRVLHRIQTPMQAVLARCNKDSQNLFAECLLKRMGHAFTGAPGSWENGAAAVRMFLHERMGSRGAAITIADGSGMSRNNRISARHMVSLLSAMHQDDKLGPPLRESLSVGGEDGTLQLRFRRGVAGQVYGKSGYINQVSALSGYLVYGEQENAAPPRVIAFSLLFNGFKPPVYNHQVKQVQNKIVELIDEAVAIEAETRLGG